MGEYVFGFHPVREALRRRPEKVERVLLAASEGKRRREIEELCSRGGVRCESSSASEISARVSGVHNGFLAEMSGRAFDGEAGSSARSGADPDLVVLLEDVQDPRNLGALLRVCEGAGVGRVLVRDRGSAPLSPTVVKASAGAAEHVEIERIPNSANAIRALQESGYWVYGADGGGEPVWDVDLSGKIVLCLGGEERGLRRRTRELCDRLIALPMRGRVESLNVSTAAAALLYEALRQRR